MYNLPIDDKYTFFEFNIKLSSKFHPDDIQLASTMAKMLKITTIYFLDETMSSWYLYKYSKLEHTPFTKFSQNIKNMIYKIFIDKLTLKGYVSLRCLELMNEEFNLSYHIYGPTDYSGSDTSDRFLLYISNSPFQIFINDINDYFRNVTSQKYHKILKEKLPIFVEEYNKTNKQKTEFSYKDIDKLCIYLDVNNNKQVIEYLYSYPLLYNYLREYSPKTDYTFWVNFLLSYKCNAVAKRHQNTINTIIKNVIIKNFSDDEKLFNLFVNKKSASHISIYFSKTLKENLRKDLNLSLVCYGNSCVKHRKGVKRMLGPKITQSSEFRYMYGAF